LNWSNLREDYERLGTIGAVAQAYGCTWREVRRELTRQDIPRNRHWGAVMRREMTAEYRQKISAAGIGHPTSEATRAKISESLKGHAVLEETKAKIRVTRADYRWSDETRAKFHTAMVGRKPSEAARQAMRDGCARPEVKERKRQLLLQRFPLIQGNKQSNTPIEVRLQNALTQAGIGWLSQQRKLNRYIVDLELTDAPIILEADGTLHLLPRGIERDRKRDAALRDAGYTVLHFTGKQIYHDINGCVERVREALGNAQEIMGQSELHGDM